jgi:hypothetical protein
MDFGSILIHISYWQISVSIPINDNTLSLSHVFVIDMWPCGVDRGTLQNSLLRCPRRWKLPQGHSPACGSGSDLLPQSDYPCGRVFSLLISRAWSGLIKALMPGRAKAVHSAHGRTMTIKIEQVYKYLRFSSHLESTLSRGKIHFPRCHVTIRKLS